MSFAEPGDRSHYHSGAGRDQLPPVKLPITIVLLIIILYLFHYSPFGYYCRAIGENESAVRYTGVNVKKIKILAFLISELWRASPRCSWFHARGLQSSLGTGFEMNVMMAIFVAGVPVTGGIGHEDIQAFAWRVYAARPADRHGALRAFGLDDPAGPRNRPADCGLLSVTLNNKGPEGFKGIFSFKRKRLSRKHDP